MTQQVVICCAEEDEPNLAPVLAELHSRGCAPELFPGVDQDPMRLGAIVDAQAEPTLFVFCESEQFRSRVVRQALGVLGARKGPADSTMVVPLALGPAEVSKRILEALRSAPRASAPEASEPERKLMRDVVRLPSKGGPSAAPKAAASAHDEQDEASPAWTGPKQGGHDPGTRMPGRSAQVPSAATLDLDFENVIVPASSNPDEAATSLREAILGTGDAPGQSLRGELPDPAQANKVTGPQAPVSRPPSPAPLPERRRYLNTFVWLAVLAAVAGTAWVIQRSVWSSSGGAAGHRGAPGVDPVAGQGDEGAAAQTASTGAGQDARLADGEPAPEGSSDAIVDAIERGELRILNLLYVASADFAEWDYTGAESYCAELRIGGLPGFRLPGEEEIKLVRRANMLQRGRYWSSEGAGEGFAFVLDTEEGMNLVRARRRFRSARALCVRTH